MFDTDISAGEWEQSASVVIKDIACCTVQTTSLKSLYQFIVALHGDATAQAVFAQSGIDLKWIGCQGSSISLMAYCALLEQAAKHTGCDNFGLWVGDQLKAPSFGALGYLALNSPNLYLALKNFCDYYNAYQKFTVFSFKEVNGVIHLSYQIQHGEIIQRRQNAEMMLSFMVGFIRQVLGRAWQPKEVYFEHPRPVGWMEHRKLFGSSVYFEQRTNTLLFSSRELQREMPAQDPSLLDFMQHMLCSEQPLVKPSLIASTQTLQLIKAKVREVLAYGEPKLEDVAITLHLPTAQIIRSLKAGDYSFSSLVDEVRQELATYYLQQFQITVSELALLLGYSETSAFSRAFRRWFDCTPREWRNMMLLQAS